MVSMARPFLADPEFVNKAAANRADEINTCIGCNQACLDHIFARQLASCLVNPFACRETEMKLQPASRPQRIAVVGAGPAGLACATTAAARGHYVTLFEAAAGAPDTRERRIRGNAPVLPHPPATVGRARRVEPPRFRGPPARL
jgi:2,4-dienoyl-CoA reductase (NADPH2)